MPVSPWTEEDTRKAREIWQEYQQQHDLSNRQGQTAGIDPVTGRIWFGESIQDIVAGRDAEGLTGPLFFERVGSKSYLRKGGRR
jgi:hypothetical protein